jgi:hypothetical protein
VNVLAGEKEYTEWRMLSLFGNVTEVPVWITETRGTNWRLTWSIVAFSGPSG